MPQDRAHHPRTGSATGIVDERRAARTPSVDEPASGHRFAKGDLIDGRYRIEGVLGTGGMGTVYEATQLAISRRVALKVVRREYSVDPAMAARFSREARAASAVKHPNVVVVYDFGSTTDGTFFMAMELLAGETLLDRMRREPMSLPEAVATAMQIASALEAAHQAGVVHRDLKPDNVFLLPTGALKVLDFGIARMTATAPMLSEEIGAITEVGQVLGTPRYISPEAVARMRVGPAADLYALGAMLFEMIAHRPVFMEQDGVELMGAHLRIPAPSLHEVLPDRGDIPLPLIELVQELLAKQPFDRPASARAVIDRLAAIDLMPVTGSQEMLTEPGYDRRWTAFDNDSTAISEMPSYESPLSAPTPVPATPPPPQAATPAPAVAALSSAVQIPAVSTRPSTSKTPVLSPRAAPPKNERRERILLAILAVATVAFLFMEQRAHEPAQETSAAVRPEREATPLGGSATRTIRVRVRVSPPDATLTWDARPIGGELEVPADGQVHRLGASADGHRASELDVVADRDRDIEISLQREDTR